MSVIEREFDNYQIFYIVGSQPEAVINCYMDAGTPAGHFVGTLTFCHDLPEISPSEVTGNGNLIVHMPKRMFRDVVDILRHEKPLYLRVDPENGEGIVVTSWEGEPIGELEPPEDIKLLLDPGNFPRK